MIFIRLFVVLCGLGVWPGVAWGKHFNVFVVTGQSNARPEYALGVKSGLQATRAWEDVVVFNSQRSGHWLKEWVAEGGDGYGEGPNFLEDLWNPEGDSGLQRFLSDLLAAGDTYTIRGLFWFQGEGDSGSVVAQANYADRLVWMMQRLRAEYGRFEIAVTVVDWNRSMPDRLAATGRSPEDVEAIRAQLMLAADRLDAVSVDSAGWHRTDLWHISRDDDPLGFFANATEFGAVQARAFVDRFGCAADLTRDGLVNFFDLQAYVASFVKACP